MRQLIYIVTNPNQRRIFSTKDFAPSVTLTNRNTAERDEASHNWKAKQEWGCWGYMVTKGFEIFKLFEVQHTHCYKFKVSHAYGVHVFVYTANGQQCWAMTLNAYMVKGMPSYSASNLNSILHIQPFTHTFMQNFYNISNAELVFLHSYSFSWCPQCADVLVLTLGI